MVIAIFSICPCPLKKLYNISFQKSVCGKEEEYPGIETQRVLAYLVQSKIFFLFYFKKQQ